MNRFTLAFIVTTSSLWAQQLPVHEGQFVVRGEQYIATDHNLSGNIFDDVEPVQVDIESNFKRLIMFKDDPNYQKGMLAYWLNDTTVFAKKMRIKVRGNTRIAICDMPPLKIDVKKTKVENKYLENLQDTKVVLPCQDGNQFEQYVYKEYLAYKIYNIITPFSYQVRLANLNLIDTEYSYSQEDMKTFFIERDKAVRKRLDLKEATYTELTPIQLSDVLYLNPSGENLKHFNILALFQLMIGNTDWAANNYHNTKVFYNDEVIYPLPYDFDYSGLVNADYAVSSNSLPIKKVTDRHYLGPCASEEEFEEALTVFLEKKEEILTLIRNEKHLTRKSRQQMIDYIEQFYAEMGDTQQREMYRATNCRVFD